jgi:hypothetical protein
MEAIVVDALIVAAFFVSLAAMRIVAKRAIRFTIQTYFDIRKEHEVHVNEETAPVPGRAS